MHWDVSTLVRCYILMSACFSLSPHVGLFLSFYQSVYAGHSDWLYLNLYANREVHLCLLPYLLTSLNTSVRQIKSIEKDRFYNSRGLTISGAGLIICGLTDPDNNV